MLENTHALLEQARREKYAVGAFNIYNLEGALAVVQAAQELDSPVIIQILPSALAVTGTALIRLCLAAGDAADVPVSVHLDHCRSKTIIQSALKAGISSVMADGSMLDHAGNLAFTRDIVALAVTFGAGVEAELGRMTGTEDGIPCPTPTGEMTDPDLAADFVNRTGVQALAVCIGNIHGRYTAPPRLDFDRLLQINQRLDMPLVLHGTSGLPEEMIRTAIELGVCKFNVNTEVRSAYINRLADLFNQGVAPELIRIINESIAAMKTPVKKNILLFGSAGKAIDIKNR